MRQILAGPFSGVRSKEIMDNTGRLRVATRANNHEVKGLGPYRMISEREPTSMYGFQCFRYRAASMTPQTSGPDARSN